MEKVVKAKWLVNIFNKIIVNVMYYSLVIKSCQLLIYICCLSVWIKKFPLEYSEVIR